MSIKKLTAIASFNLSFHWFSLGIIIPIMSLFLIEKGFSLFQLGIALAIYSGTTVLLELPTGGLADAIGRKRVYILSLSLQLAGGILIVFLSGYYAILICFILQGAARSLSSGTMDAHFIDEFYKADPDINLQKVMAKIGIFIPLALGIGSVIGGFLPMTLGTVTERAFGGNAYAANYICYAAAVAIQIIATLIMVHENRERFSGSTVLDGIRKVPDVLKTSVSYGIKHPVVLLLLITGFIWGFSISGLEGFWQPQVRNIIGGQEGSSWIFGLLTFGYFLAASAGNLLITPLCKLFKDNYPAVLFVTRSIMGILYLFLAFQIHLPLFSVFYITLFLWNGMQESPQSSIFNTEIPSEKRSTLISFASLFLQAGGISGSLLLGFLAQTYSIKTAWVIASIFITASALLYLRIPAAEKRNNDNAETLADMAVNISMEDTT